VDAVLREEKFANTIAFFMFDCPRGGGHEFVNDVCKKCRYTL
jgi:hypothetical protein